MRFNATAMLCLFAGLTLPATPAYAADTKSDATRPGAWSWALSGSAYAYFTFDEKADDDLEHYEGASATWTGTLEGGGYKDIVEFGFAIDHEYPADNLLLAPSFNIRREGTGHGFSLEASATYTIDHDARVDDGWDTPSVLLYAEDDRFGRIDLGSTGSALNNGCIQPPNVADNFANEDFVTVGTCPGYDTSPLVRYTPPSLGGLTVAVSYMPRGIIALDAEEAEESAAVSLNLERGIAGGTLTASLGVEQVLSTSAPASGADPTPTSYQGGFAFEKGKWTFGAAFGATDVSQAHEDEWGVGFGLAYKPTEQFSASAEIIFDDYGDAGVRTTETGLGLTAIWKPEPEDRLVLDAAFWAVERRAAANSRSLLKFGVGVSTSF
jgi:opacity protein-like surface antigen